MSSIPVPDGQTYYSSRWQDDVDALAWPVFSQRALDVAPRRPDRCAGAPPWRKHRPTTTGGWTLCHTFDTSITSASPSRTSTP